MKSGINHTFEKVYGDESDAIFRFCLVRVSNREKALDITQDTFLRLWQNMQDGKEILNNRAFLFTVAHRLIIDWYRKKKSLSLDSIMNKDSGQGYDFKDESSLGDTTSIVEGKELLDRLHELPESYRDPVYLRFMEGLSPPEIGNILGISPNAASVRVNRGLAELRKVAGYEDKEDQKN